MKNQAFVRQNELDQRRKLRVVLRKLTADYLTEEQHLAIEQAAGHRYQSRLRLYSSPYLLQCAINQDLAHYGNVATKLLFGSAEDPPMAVLVRSIRPERIESKIYIYLPDKKEEA